jgi:competence protein ComEA
MRSRRSANEQVAEVARRRLELLSAELAEIRPDPVETPNPRSPGGSGEPLLPEEEPLHDRTPNAVHEPVHEPAHEPVHEPGPGRHAHRPVGRAVAVGGWTRDRLPPTLQGRIRLTAAHLTVLALLVAAALALTTWWLLRGGSASTVLPPVSSTPSALAPVPAASSSIPSSSLPPSGAPAGTSPSSSGSIVVDVAGKVRRPGIATLPLGSRVVDALEAAGGARSGVRLGSLNLARVLADGEQILVGVEAPGGVAASAASAPTSGASGPATMVNLNSASQTELEELPGVGPVTAQKILAFRTANGAFSAVDELLEVSGIGDATLAEIAPFVTL